MNESSCSVFDFWTGLANVFGSWLGIFFVLLATCWMVKYLLIDEDDGTNQERQSSVPGFSIIQYEDQRRIYD